VIISLVEWKHLTVGEIQCWLSTEKKLQENRNGS
jgi:hypothetical protein